MYDRADFLPPPDTRGHLCILDRRECGEVAARDSSATFLRKRVPQPSQGLCIAPPVGQNLDPKVEKNRCSDEALDFHARRAPELANARSLMPHENALLALALDIDDRPNVYRRAVLAKLLDRARHTVWDFVLQLFQRRLSHQLTDEKTEWLCSDVVLGIQKGTLWKLLVDVANQRVDAFTGERRKLKRSGSVAAQRFARSLTYRVDLVEREHDRR